MTPLMAKLQEIEEATKGGHHVLINSLEALKFTSALRLAVDSLEEVKSMTDDCTCDEPEKGHDSTLCHLFFEVDNTLHDITQLGLGEGGKE